MKKRLSVLLVALLLLVLVIPASAASEPPKITLQPQNYQYPEYSVAMYTVKASGSNLRAFWYLEYEGKTYSISDVYNGYEPWESYAGETYGPVQDGNTFTWFFGGIEAGLNGAEIWCVVEDGHYDVVSERAVISVQGDAMPPEILEVPASLSVSRGQEAEIRCVARSNTDAQLSFQWYETSSGKLWDIRAMDGEESDYMFCNTQTPGTRYYVCCVTSTDGGRAYSSVIPVTVADAPAGNPPTFLTKTLPRGTVGEDYGFILETDDWTATFSIAYNAGGKNEFDKTGLVLTQEGMLAGKLTKAGTYTFTVCVGNDYGEDYGVLTLTVTDPVQTTTPPATTPAPETTPIPETTPVPDTTPSPAPGTTPEASPDTTPAPVAPQPPADRGSQGMPWWGYVMIAMGGVIAGLVISLILTKRK